MAGGEALEILRQIQALVSDKLQVVNYKWLSRSFSVSSNHAKRLLKEFVDEHGNGLEVIYTLSGWLKNNPQTYCIKLVSGLNLTEVKKEFKGDCSVQVYSVQACIPEDATVVWNTEYVQAEELFNQPSTVVNCLRDNRFCGVSNSYVKRTVDGKSTATSPVKNDVGTSLKTSSILKAPVPAPKQGPVAELSTRDGKQLSSAVNSSGKSNKSASTTNDQTNKPQVIKESITVTNTNKNKGKNGNSSEGGSSIANLWGRATVKAKPTVSDATATNSLPKCAISAEAQICAREAAEAISSDDEAEFNYKRETNGARNRKRRVVIDSSDDEKEDKQVVGHSAPGPPCLQPGSNSPHDTRSLTETRNTSSEDLKRDESNVKEDKSKEMLSGSDRKIGQKSNITGISLQKRTYVGSPEAIDIDDKKESNKKNAASSSPKRRKVLKTRIDERGREVTEVVWEGEPGDTLAEETKTKSDAGNRPPVANKPQAAERNPPVNQAGKPGNKKAPKGGGKDAKQGNILSFFKKV